MEINHKLPDDEIHNRKYNKRGGEKAANKDHRCKHHKMVPIEYSAGRAAFISYYQSEGAPNKHTYKVANVKCDAYKEQMLILYNFKMLKGTESSYKCTPQYNYLPCRLIGVGYVLLQFIFIEQAIYRGTEFYLK